MFGKTMFNKPKEILVDYRNFDTIKDQIIKEVSECQIMGFDFETEDTEAHDGIKLFRKENAEGFRSGRTKNAFDWRRMKVAGFSLYAQGSPNCYYFNIGHADEDNTLPWALLKPILDARPADCSIICHNAPFELTVAHNSLGYDLTNVICTLQMAVSAFGPDEYPVEDYTEAQLGKITELFPQASILFADKVQQEDENGEAEFSGRFNPQQQELLNKVLGKSSDAAHSYNGLVDTISYGYGLKKLIKSFFKVDMTTYEQCLNGAANMGQITGEQVVSYGCDDSYWAVELFYKLLDFMSNSKNPEVIDTFLKQENPMIYVFADIRKEGMVINKEAVENRRNIERATFAQKLRDFKTEARKLLPFREELDERLTKYEKWYREGKKPKKLTKKQIEQGFTPTQPEPGGVSIRKRFEEFLLSENVIDDFKMACQISNAVSNAWAGYKVGNISLTHYYQTRIFMYDLCQVPAIVYRGKISSDGEDRGVVLDKLKELSSKNPDKAEFYATASQAVKLLGDIVSVEQRMKLYLTPYMLLTDPETNRIYPEVSSQLATRRMGASNPNPMQLSKRGESTYVRGFYLPDAENEVMISLDWSQIELVLIGEFSGDKKFKEAYGQLPYKDLHLGTTADLLSIKIPEVTEDLIKNMHKMKKEELPPSLLINPKGEILSPDKAKKFWRTEVGKGANFNYWYSGALATVGEKLGWSASEMWQATEKYRQRFPDAEMWRVNLIRFGREYGYVKLPDGHTRVKYEATYEWKMLTDKFFTQMVRDIDGRQHPDAGIRAFGNEITRATQTRAGNQLVNAMIQGSSATLAKRSILGINKKIAELGLRARFKMPIHDELIFSVHRDDAVEFIRMAREVMTNHPEIIKTLKINASVSIGLTFEPYHSEKAPFGQIEVDEAPELDFIPEEYHGGVLPDSYYEQVINYLYEQKNK